MYSSVTGFYFSATGNSQKCVEKAARALNGSAKFVDCTNFGSAVEASYGEDDFVVFGGPVYAGRLPAPMVEALKLQKGNNTPCYILVSYGNRHYDDALLELYDIVKAQGFVVKGAAAVVAKHTYGSIAKGRPNRAALDVLAENVIKAAESGNTDVAVPGNRPYRDGMSKGNFKPMTGGSCTKCQLCVRSCPMNAIESDCRTVNDKCMSCFRCIYICPMEAKHVEYDAYEDFADMFTQKLSAVAREDEYFA